MRALCWHGKGDVRVDTVPDPKIEHPRDAIIRITACAICGSDLHLLDGYQPTMESGDILGHENMGEVIELGSRGDQPQDRRPRRRPVHDQLRPVLVLPEGPVLVLRPDQPQCRDGGQGDGPVARRAVRLQPHAGRLQRRPGRISARADGRRRPDQDPRQRHRRAGAVPLRHLPDRLHGRRERADRAGRHRRDLGLRSGRPVRHPLGADDGRRPRHRDRRGARAAGDGARPAAPRRSISRRSTSTTS